MKDNDQCRRHEMFVENSLRVGFRPIRDEIISNADISTNIRSLTGFLENGLSIHQSLTDESKNTAQPISQSVTDQL